VLSTREDRRLHTIARRGFTFARDSIAKTFSPLLPPPSRFDSTTSGRARCNVSINALYRDGRTHTLSPSLSLSLSLLFRSLSLSLSLYTFIFLESGFGRRISKDGIQYELGESRDPKGLFVAMKKNEKQGTRDGREEEHSQKR